MNFFKKVWKGFIGWIELKPKTAVVLLTTILTLSGVPADITNGIKMIAGAVGLGSAPITLEVDKNAP